VGRLKGWRDTPVASRCKVLSDETVTHSGRTVPSRYAYAETPMPREGFGTQITVAVTDSGPVVELVHVQAMRSGPVQGLKPDGLALLVGHLDALVERSLTAAAEAIRPDEILDSLVDDSMITPEALSEVRPSERRRVTDGALREIADVYEAALRDRSTTPSRAVAEAFGMNPRTAHGWVGRARKAGYITSPPPRGRLRPPKEAATDGA